MTISSKGITIQSVGVIRPANLFVDDFEHIVSKGVIVLDIFRITIRLDIRLDFRAVIRR